MAVLQLALSPLNTAVHHFDDHLPHVGVVASLVGMFVEVITGAVVAVVPMIVAAAVVAVRVAMTVTTSVVMTGAVVAGCGRWVVAVPVAATVVRLLRVVTVGGWCRRVSHPRNHELR